MQCPKCNSDTKNQQKRILNEGNKASGLNFPQALRDKVDNHTTFRRYRCDTGRHVFYTREEIVVV